MTDEEKWEEYLSKRICKSCSKVCEGDCDYANPNKQSYLDGFSEGYKKATERAYERQKDLTDTYVKDGEKIKQLEKENEEFKIANEHQALVIKQKDDLILKLKAQIAKQRCKNAYVIPDKNSNAVPCYTVYRCNNCSRRELAE